MRLLISKIVTTTRHFWQLASRNSQKIYFLERLNKMNLLLLLTVILNLYDARNCNLFKAA